VATSGGGSIPDLSNGGSRPIGESDFETIHGIGVGGALQVTETAVLFGHENHVVFGGSLDRKIVDFQTSAELGVIDPTLQVLPSGFFVDTPENTNFNAVPLSLRATNAYYGIFLTDTFNLTPALAITASG
jgi:iron complex outermembrane receptor protein